MIRSAIIRDFRCFQAVKLENLRRINVITGHNATGKTALLEALGLVASSNQDLAIRFRNWRGMALAVGSEVNADYDKTVWQDLFRDFDLSKTIRISTKGSDGHTRSLVIQYDQKTPSRAIQVSGSSTPLFASPITFQYKKMSGKPWTVRAIPIGAGFHYEGAESRPPDGAFFAATIAGDIAQTVMRFTSLSVSRRSDSVVEEINREFPFIKNIETGVRAGTNTIFLDIEGVKEKVPIGFVSGGISKIVAILIAISFFQRGIVIIDEIENGIFHDRLAPMWGAVHKFAVANDVQVFASTHSAECISALETASEKFRKDDLSFIRIERSGDEKKLVQLSGETMFKVNAIGDIR